MRLLIYGFGPYGQFRENITEKILRRLPPRRHIKKIVFPVKFHRRRFVSAVRENDPGIVLGLGQCARGRFLRIEKWAVNRRRNHRREKPKPIVAGGPRRLFTNLKLNPGQRARWSRNAGDYVCNYSMYVVLNFLRRQSRPACFGFVHIPHDYDAKTAVGFLLNAVAELETMARRNPKA